MTELKGLTGVSAWLVYNKVVFNLLFLQRFNFAKNERTIYIIALQNCTTLDEYKTVAELLNEPDGIVEYTFAQALAEFKTFTDEQKESAFFELLTFVDLSSEEKLRLLTLHTDDNAIPYNSTNVANLSAGECVNLLVMSLVACSNINCDFALLSDDDLKTGSKYRVDIRDEAGELLNKAPDMPTGNLLVASLKNIFVKMRAY